LPLNGINRFAIEWYKKRKINKNVKRKFWGKIVCFKQLWLYIQKRN
jgi:hypothetical protein